MDTRLAVALESRGRTWGQDNTRVLKTIRREITFPQAAGLRWDARWKQWQSMRKRIGCTGGYLVRCVPSC